RVEGPGNYFGKSVQEYSEFIYACEALFELQPRTFRRERKKVVYASTKLKGNAQANYRRFTRAVPGGRDAITWEMFKEHLLDQVRDLVNRASEFEHK
ncbi:uncharacterized protein K452DRAFT_231695, partial [Aplosporella prunicola CBS 121167]